MGTKVSSAAAELFERHEYRDYLELHGLSVQLTEALAEYWHARVRAELGIGAEDSDSLGGLLKLDYRGARYSFGYPACPTLPTGLTWCACSSRSGSESSCPRSCSCTRAVHRRTGRSPS